jgi:uncharacterized protein YfaS (alpha-2-macroglobulin family)/TolA-binding protein
MRARFLLSALALAAFPLLATADDKPGPAAALRAAEVAFRDRDWARAAEAMRGVRGSFPGSAEAVEAWVLEARALLVGGKPREALDSATEFLKAHGDVAWAGRMRATVADAYAALQAPADEAKALRARAEFLTGTEQRARIAALYVALADQDFDGRDAKDDLGRTVKKKDYAKALEAYRVALEVGVAPADRLRVTARVALALEEAKDWAGAVAVWDALLRDDSEKPGADPEAWLVGRARARLRGGNAPEARKDLRDALAKHPKGAKHLEVLRLSAEERFLAANGPEGDLAFEEGVQFLRRAMAEHRDDPQAPAVHRALAEAYAGRGQWQKAAEEWRALVERFPADPAAPEWRNARAEALANANQWDEAVAEWRAFLGAFPNHPLWQQVQSRIPAARFQKGVAKREEGDVDGAIAAWRAFAEEYPTDPRAPEALVEVGVLLRGRKDFEGALAVWRGVTGRYAQSPQAPRAWLLVAQTLEDDLNRLDDAIAEYEALVKKHGNTGEANEAQARLARLRGKHLEVRSERVVGSKDPAVLKVVTRNLPTLKVKVFRLGLEDWFRRKRTLAGVENLQVEIVKPDMTAEWRVDSYVPYALVQAERAVPVDGPGAYVVVAGDDDLTSTTLLLVSDVETVVKAAAGRQVFVWARDRSTGRPVEGARVLASDGSKVFAEGVTGKDGVWMADTDQTATRVLVLSGAHAASSEFEAGPVFAEGWSTKVHVSTDRPAYRPGQTVKWRGIYRRVTDGAYRMRAGVKATAVLLDARGAEVERKEVVSSAASVFEGEFAIDGEAALGDWSVRVDVDNLSFAGKFAVLEYRKPEFTLTVEPGKPSYATGEEVKATVRLRYAFGGPVTAAPVMWEVQRVARDFTPSAVDDYSWYFQDAESLERARRAARSAPRGVVVARGRTSTDDRGEAGISFPTTERDEDAEYVVTAVATDVTRRFVADEGRIPVVRRDHWAVVTTDKKVFRPKQEARATVVTVDANQNPVSKSGKVVLARVKRSRVVVEEKRGPRPPGPVEIKEEEIEVQWVPVSTDAKGRAEVRLLMPGAGTYRIRYAATDARGALVTAAATVDVSGEAEDLTKDARLVAAKETYVEGEKAEVLLQSPVSKVTALLTFEGEKVLAYRMVEVDGPSTMLEVPVEGAYAPNVTLKVAIPAAGKLLEADDEFVVLRHMKVEVTASKETASPGEEVTFSVRTTDAAGNPVQAEVGFSVVDEAMFQVAPDRSPAIRPFFYDRKRLDRVVTSSSLGFKTYGTTRETNKDLLANAEAQAGEGNVVFARSALRLAREALEKGDVDNAVAQAAAATAADPLSWDARAFMSELRAKPEAAESMKRFADDVRGKVEEARADRRLAGPAHKNWRAGGGAVPPGLRETGDPSGPGAATPAPSPTTPVEGYRFADAERKDHNESDDDKYAEEESAASPGADLSGFAVPRVAVGAGSGAGGASKLRAFGGRKSARPSGGKPQAGGDAEKAAGVYFNDGADGDFKARADSTFERALGTALGEVSKFGRDFDVELAQAANLANPFLRAPEPTQELRKTFADTAAWEPHVATDAQGKAEVKVKLPDNLTRWRATARGGSGESLFGEGRGSVVARRDLLVRVDAPRFFTQGDRAVVPTAVHNGNDSEVTATVKMRAEGVDVAGEDGTVTVPGHGRATRDRTVSAKDPGGVRIEVEAAAAQGGDRAEATLATQPRGVRATDGRSGRLSTRDGGTSETFLEVPAGAVPGATRLAVVLYPGLDSAVMDALLALDLFPYGCVEQTVHRFLPAAWAKAALTSAGSPYAKRLDDLEKALRASVVRLKNLANADGSYGWFRGGKGDPTMTALALLGLVEAQRTSVPGAQEPVQRAAAALKAILRSAPDDVQALGHWALAAAGSPDGEAYAVTFRRRNEELSVPGLAWLTFAALEAGKSFDAEELVRLILARRVEDGDATRWPGKKDDCFLPSDRLATALAVRALVEAGAATDAAERGLRWLLAHRADGGFGTTTETAAFVGAASSWLSKSRAAAFGGKVVVLADGVPVRTVDVVPGQPLSPKDRRFLVDVATWAPGRHALAFRLEGQGDVHWAARLDAVVASDDLPADEHGMKVERLYVDAEIPAIEGAELPPKPGYDVLRPSARPKVEAKSRDRAAPGERILVRVAVTAPRDLKYVLVEDPLPAGFEVIAETAGGPFDWEERRDDRQVFFLSDVKAGTVVLTYVLQAVHLGAFTALPTRAVAMYLPEVSGRAAGHRIEVVPDRRTDAETSPTPDELYARALDLLAKRKWAEAGAAFQALEEGFPLRDEVVEEVEAARLRCAIETKDAKGIVRAREELVRRAPGRIPGDVDAARAIAAAYADTAAYPVASGLFRDLVARAFGAEARWADFLKARGRETDGLAALGEALRAYPVGNATADAALKRAVRFREVRRPEGMPGKAGAPMDQEGLDALRDFTAHYAETPLADPGNYALVEALRRVRDLDGAVEEATAFPRRFPESRFVDDTLWFLADSRLQKFEAAPTPESAKSVIETADRLIKEKFHAPNGALAVSEFRPRAWHAIGRVRHVLGNLDGAIAAYREAAGQIEDAREALAYLTEARLELEESVAAPVAGAAKFPVRYRNVTEVKLEAYPVDLQVLFALRRTLVGLNKIELAGIKPAKTWSFTPADGGDHAWHDAQVELPAGADAAGVFLVVAKAGALEASTVVVKTDLKVVLQTVGDKVRVYVTGPDAKGVRGAYVTVSDGTRIKARGMTDGRGVFEAPGVGANPFVVANKDDRFAVAR